MAYLGQSCNSYLLLFGYESSTSNRWLLFFPIFSWGVFDHDDRVGLVAQLARAHD